MNKEAFLNSLKIVYNEIINNKTEVSSNDFRNVKLYVHTNPNDEDVKAFKSFMVDFFQKPFLDLNLINALYIKDDLKYLKTQKIYKFLPFKSFDYRYRLYFYNLLTTDSTSSFWNDCINFFKSEGKCFIPQDVIDRLNNFIENNPTIIKGGKDTYLDYDTELNMYKEQLSGNNPKDFKDFLDSENGKSIFFGNRLSDYEINRNYENKKIGNIGEIFIFNKIKHMPNSIFTSRDLGNGFGYDMYYQTYENNKIIENLVEVKSTANLYGNDYIELSKNEYEIMINTLNEPNVEYHICRVFIDINKQEFEYYFLKLEGNTLKNINNNIEYEVLENNDHIFKRKQKILQYKN